MNILLVDDSRSFRAYMKQQLKQFGHRVRCASDGSEALQHLHGKLPDLVLLDVEMPGLNGYQVAREMRIICKDEWFPIIFISGLILDDDIAKGIAAGGDDYLLKPCNDTVLKAKIMAMQRLVNMHRELLNTTRQLGEEVEQRRKAQEKLLHLSLHDPLTDLPNRRMYEEFSERMIQRAKRHDGKLAFLALDLDRFKMVNDTLGHDQGDLLLIEVTRRFKACLREEDLIARVGGDEFLMLMEYAGDIPAFEHTCQRILDSIREPFQLAVEQARIGVSIGISFYPENGDDHTNHVKQADMALYYAKQSGRQCMKRYTQAIEIKQESMRFLNVLHTAVEKEEFRVFYQPQLDVKSGVIVGVESLLRWSHPERGLLLPEAFLTELESSGLIVPVGTWMLDQICRDLARWRLFGTPINRVTLNVSAVQLLDETLPARLAKALHKHALAAGQLELEICENVLLSAAKSKHKIQQILVAIADLGVRLTLDNFGAGYASLGGLQQLPFSGLKIDRMFIENITDDKAASGMLKALVDMAKSLSIDKVVAEGISSKEQLSHLDPAGCSAYQGFLSAHPMPVDELELLFPAQQHIAAPDILNELLSETCSQKANINMGCNV